MRDTQYLKVERTWCVLPQLMYTEINQLSVVECTVFTVKNKPLDFQKNVKPINVGLPERDKST